MFGVAISRVRDLASLRVMHYTPSILVPPVKSVKDFLAKPTQEPTNMVAGDTCCRMQMMVKKLYINNRSI